MSLQNAAKLIERIKSDKQFKESIFSIKDLEERMFFWKEAGFDCSVGDIETLKKISSKEESSIVSLPLSWQAGGPCHRKCAPIVQQEISTTC